MGAIEFFGSIRPHDNYRYYLKYREIREIAFGREKVYRIMTTIFEEGNEGDSLLS